MYEDRTQNYDSQIYEEYHSHRPIHERVLCELKSPVMSTGRGGGRKLA